jgi:hypothetical protein
MSALFNLKMLGSAALALGISTVSLWPEMASANIVFDFNGTCNGNGCPTTSDTATAVITLTDAYVYGMDVTSATFISIAYSSSASTFEITSANSPGLEGGFNSDGSLVSGGFEAQVDTNVPVFVIETGEWGAQGGVFTETEDGDIFSVTNVTPPSGVPEPSTWAMLLIGFAGLGYASRRVSRKSATLAA